MIAYVHKGPIEGAVRAVASKSDAHRLLIAAALADAPTRIAIADSNADIDATVGCLRELGAGIERRDGFWTVTPSAGVPNATLNCGESGSTLRFLLPVSAFLAQEARFEGAGRLPQRPLGALLDAMRAHGCAFTGGALPLARTGGLQSGTYLLPGDVSSQFISGLLFALPMAQGDSEIRLTTPLESSAYVDMTIRTLAKFGVRAYARPGCYAIPGGQRYRSPGALEAEGDWSGAAFPLSLGALGGRARVEGLTRDSAQADRAILPLLGRFGARTEEGDGWASVSRAELRGAEIDVRECPDLFPVLAVVACGAVGESVFTGGARLRAKESDRIRATADMIRALGGACAETADGLRVFGTGRLRGGRADGRGDHRIVMAAAVAACLCEGETAIEDAEAVSKSYPSFWNDYRRLGGAARIE